MRELIFVDTETTGFEDDPEATIVELTWARREGEPKTIWFGVEEVPNVIDELIGFNRRGLAGRTSPWSEVQEFLAASDGQTMVAANPPFDREFIKRACLWQFHYRSLDIETYAMAKLCLDEVPSMKNISHILSKDHGLELTQPDHTSLNDVLAMREAYLYLEDL